MKRMIELSAYEDGEPVFLDMDAITSVSHLRPTRHGPQEEGSRTLVCIGEDTFLVREPAREIAQLIDTTRRSPQ